jgi:DNA-binding NtrC family response regulator
MGELTILVVDDEEILRKTLKTFLEDEGYKILVASNGAEAMDQIKNNAIDIAIVDVNLPDIDGATIILRFHEIKPSIKFIVHTGDNNYTIPPKLISIGISEKNILFKPVFNMKSIVEMIAQISD